MQKEIAKLNKIKLKSTFLNLLRNMTYLSFFYSWVISEQSIFRVILIIWTCTAHSWMGTYFSSWTASELFSLALASILHYSFFFPLFDFFFFCGGRWLKSIISLLLLPWNDLGREEMNPQRLQADCARVRSTILHKCFTSSSELMTMLGESQKLDRGA